MLSNFNYEKANRSGAQEIVMKVNIEDQLSKIMKMVSYKNEWNEKTYHMVGGRPHTRWPRMYSTPASIGTWPRTPWLKSEYKVRGQSGVDPC